MSDLLATQPTPARLNAMRSQHCAWEYSTSPRHSGCASARAMSCAGSGGAPMTLSMNNVEIAAASFIVFALSEVVFRRQGN